MCYYKTKKWSKIKLPWIGYSGYVIKKWRALNPGEQRYKSKEIVHIWLQNWCAYITNHIYKAGM